MEGKGITTIRLYATKMGQVSREYMSLKKMSSDPFYEVNFDEEINKKSLSVRPSSRILPWVFTLDKAV